MFRLKKHKEGWIVERKKYYWTLFGIRYKWVHYNHYSGLEESPFYCRKAEGARDVALQQMKLEINHSFYFKTQ